MAHSVRLIGAALVAVTLWACSDDGSCKTQGAERVRGVCDCPEGTTFVEDRSNRSTSCVADGNSAVAAVDSGRDAALVTPGAPKQDSALDAALGSAATLLGDAAPVGVGDSGSAQPDDSCAVDGQLRCALSGTSARERCMSGRWSVAESCLSGEVCDAGDAAPATCRAALDVCKGNADKPACDGSTMTFCGKTGLADRATPCASKLQCEVGLAHGPALRVCRVRFAAQKHCSRSVAPTARSTSLCSPRATRRRCATHRPARAPRQLVSLAARPARETRFRPAMRR